MPWRDKSHSACSPILGKDRPTICFLSCCAPHQPSRSLLTSSWVPLSPDGSLLSCVKDMLFSFILTSDKSAHALLPQQPRCLHLSVRLGGLPVYGCLSMSPSTEAHLSTSCTHALGPVTTRTARDTGNICHSQVVGFFFFFFPLPLS